MQNIRNANRILCHSNSDKMKPTETRYSNELCPLTDHPAVLPIDPLPDFGSQVQ
jgi:hypothetical protein